MLTIRQKPEMHRLRSSIKETDELEVYQKKIVRTYMQAKTRKLMRKKARCTQIRIRAVSNSRVLVLCNGVKPHLLFTTLTVPPLPYPMQLPDPK
jgi:hypothetical protein